MDLTQREGERIIYGVLDMMGDVGGFTDSLNFIALVMLFVFSFSPVDMIVIGKLFSYDDNKVQPYGVHQ